MSEATGVLAVFDNVEDSVTAIERLRAAGIKEITAIAPAPNHELEHALHKKRSPIPIYTLVGGLTGAAAGFALPTWTSLVWPLVTGGKPIISMPAWVIIAFELTILFGALSTVLGLFIHARLPRKPGARLVHDPSFTADRFGLWVDGPRRDEAAGIFRECGAVAVRDRAEEVTVAL
ncbi:MAG: DUF3341 domain-containing protein [Gemmatimonadota bacterium]